MRPLFFLSATEMAEQVRLKKLSPVELLDTHLARIEALNPKLNAFVQLDTERARRQAQGAEAAVMRGEAVGPLHGVPISIKSSIEVAGLRCEAGTRAFQRHLRFETLSGAHPVHRTFPEFGRSVCAFGGCRTDGAHYS